MSIARLYDFASGQPIRSSEVDAELNQLVDYLNTGHFDASDVFARYGAATQVGIGARGPSSQAGISIGADCNLYREAADKLTTDDGFKSKRFFRADDGASGASLAADWHTGGFNLQLYHKTTAVASNEALIVASYSGTTDPSFTIQYGGKLNWGAFNAVGATDTNLYRASADVLKTDDNLIVGSDAYVEGTKFELSNSGVGTRVQLLASLGGAGKHGIGFADGAGGAVDTKLYRDAADTLKSDDGVWAAGGIVTKTKAGTPSDSDLVAGMQQSGAIIIDTSGSKLWARVGSTWKSVTLA